MAENNDANLNIEVNAVANKQSAEQAVNELVSGVQKASNKGRIEVPVDITVPIDNTKKKLTKAQEDITSEISKMMAKGFSASGKDIDTLTSKFEAFTKALDAAGKGRQNKIFREIRRQVEELRKSYKALKTETNSAKSYTPKATNTKKSTRQTARDRYLDQQEQYSKRAQGAGERAELKRELDEVRRSKSDVPSSGNIKESMVNEHEMRLSRYSSYGSNWARDLAKTLKIEEARAAKTLKKWFDKDYEVGTEVGEKSGKIVSKKTGRSTTEAQMIADVYNNVKQSLTDAVRKSEAGDETITADTFTELAAIMKILNKTLMTKLSGKSLEEATSKTATDIANAISRPYSISEKDAMGFTDLTEGQEKGIGPGHENTQKELKEFQKRLESWGSDLYENVSSSVNQLTKTLSTIRASDSYRNELNRLNDTMETTFSAINDVTTETANVNRSVKIGNTKEAVEDDAAEKISKEHKDIDRDTARTVKQDAATGFNTDAKANELITLVRSILQQIQGIAPKNKKGEDIEKSQKDTEENVQEIAKDKTSSATSEAQAKNLKDYSMEMQKAWDTYEQSIDPLRAQMALTPVAGTFKNYYEGTDIVSRQRRTKEIEEERKRQLEEASKSNEVQKSTIYASPLRQGFWNSLVGTIEDVTGATKEYEEVLKANADEQDAMAAERIKTYGLNNGRNPNDTGDIAGMRRILQLYRTNKASIEQNPELAQKIRLTPGREVDTTELTKALNDALSGRQMQNAQNGGGFWKNFFGFATGGLGYAFMPSLEKSRAQADGLNQIMGNINKALQSVLINIQTKETELKGMEERGDVKFNKEGYIEKGTSAAYKTLADLEEEKLVLDSIKADLLANDEIVKRTGGRFSLLVKNLNYTSPVLKENNGILRNINSGLDKNGKALKFQTRMAEILNYTFQLMSRSIGQAFKNLLSMINPFNVIRNLFNDFSSYNVKWQRTMNVIKNNFREIILPFMDKIAQTLVNIIGFLDIISMKIQEAFGFTPISLFDQENANDFKKTYEEISNITAGFDELHDIGSNPENDADNLLGEIYKPQLSQEWIDLANQIGDLFAGVIKGDLGFGEVMAKILKIAWEGIKTLWSEIIWPFIRDTIWPGIKDNVLEILAWILGAFIAWKGLKLIGSLLWNAISGAFVKGSGTSLLKRMFTDANGVVGIGKNIGTLIAGSILAVISTMALADAINDAWTQGKSDANTGKGMNLTDQQTGMDALQGALGGAGAVLGGGMIAAALGASVALGPLLAVAAGVAALAAVVVVGAEAWAYHSQQNKLANNEMLEAGDYAEQAAETQEKLKEVTDMVNNGLEIKNTHQEKLNQLEEDYGISLDYVNKKVEAAGGNTSILTEEEKALYEQGKLTQESIENYNRLLEIQIELQKQQLWQKEEEAIALDMEAGNYELAALRIEQAELQGLITTEEATAKRIQLYKTCGEEERANLLQNLTPEQRTLMLQYTNATEEELAELAKIWDESSQNVKNALLDGVGPDVVSAFDRRMNDIDRVVEEHSGFWQGVGDTIAEIFSFGQYDSWTYNGEERYYKEGYDAKWADSEIQAIQNDNTLSEEEKRRRILNIRNMASYAVGTNYVPNDGLAYLHQGEAVIPKKYNQPYQPNSTDQAYIGQMIDTMRALDATIQQGIEVRGEFKQRGTDLVATVKKVENRNGNQPLNNSVFAR